MLMEMKVKIRAMTAARLLLIGAGAAMLTAGTACKKPEIAGTWVNPVAGLQDLSRVEIAYNCGDKQGKAYDPLSTARWVIRAHMKCARTDCVWGRAKGMKNPDGTLSARFNTFSAIRDLKIHNEGALLRVETKITYRGDRPAKVITHYLQPDQ